MARIDLTVKKDYLPGWGLWEGIRELCQNGRDAEVEFKAPLTVEWRPSKTSAVYGGRLHIENENCIMPRKALLFGETSKEGREDMIGKFGEGLKIGILALVRQGRAVLVRTGAEVWRPSINKSEVFGEDVLSFQIQTGRAEKNRVQVEIECSREEWQEFKENFLWLWRTTDNDRIETPKGTLLTAPRFKGKLFVRGIYVMTNPSLSYGFDLTHAKVDRDRKMVDYFDLKDCTRDVIQEAVARRPDLLDPFFRALEKGADDVRGFNAWNGSSVPEAVRKGVAERFRKRYGEGAIPVASIDESRAVEHLGVKGIVVGDGLRGILAAEIGDLDAVKKRLREEVVKRWSWPDLSDKERANFERAARLVQATLPVSDAAPILSRIDVVDFRDKELLGQHKDGRYVLAKKVLGRRDLALEVLVHEVAHDAGADGAKSHVSRIETIWSKVVEAVERGVPVTETALVHVPTKPEVVA